MQQQNIEQRFLAAMQESYRMVKLHGTRSNQKTRVLHGWVQDEMRQELREDAYTLYEPIPDQCARSQRWRYVLW
jgi:hypothetical protein